MDDVAFLLAFPCAGLMWLLARWVIKNPRPMGDWDFVRTGLATGRPSKRGEILTWFLGSMLMATTFSPYPPIPLMIVIGAVLAYGVFAYGLYYWCGANLKEIGKVLGVHLALMSMIVSVFSLILWFAATHFSLIMGSGVTK